MTDLDRELFNAAARVYSFLSDNKRDYADNAIVTANYQIIEESIAKIEASGELQISNASKAATVAKDAALDALMKEMREYNRTARSIAVDKLEVGVLFKMPPSGNLQKLLATAAGFYTNAEIYEDEFIAYGLPADFRAKLQTCINSLQAAIAAQNTAKSVKTGATGAVKAEITLLRTALKRLNGIMPNIYSGNAGKLAAWKSISRVSRSSGGNNNPPAAVGGNLPAA